MMDFRSHLITLVEALVQPVLSLPRCQPFLGAKRVLLRAMGVRLGKNVTIYPHVWIMPPSSKLCLGDHVDLSKGVMITVGADVSIGAGTLIGYDSKILSTNHRVPPAGSSIANAGHTAASVKIGKDVWIGANVVILPGVSIGDGTVVGAGSIVTRDLPANVIAAGTPAHAVKERG